MSDAWQKITGQALAQISAGSGAYIWGISPSGMPFRYHTTLVSPDDSSQLEYEWVKVPGATLKNISVGMDGTVYGVNASGKIYSTSSGGSSSGGDATPTWSPVSGPALAEVSVGDASHVWGVNAAGEIYKAIFARNSTLSNWQHVAGSLKWVSAAGDGTVYGVNSVGDVYTYNRGAWIKVPGQTLAQISVGDVSRVWGVTKSGAIFQYTPDSKGNFKWGQITGPSLKNIAAGADGVVYGVAPDATVYVYVG